MHPCIHEIFDETYGSTKIDEISREITDRCMKTRMLLQNLFQHIAWWLVWPVSGAAAVMIMTSQGVSGH